jgi:poly-gamma-glutamate synthesis protein (capsule biosynthesis protein)
MGKKIKFTAVGDLLFATDYKTGNGRGLDCLSNEILDIFKSSDIVLANLECTLKGKEMVASEPRVIAAESQINSLLDAGINIVSLANNHAFDCFEEGFIKLKNKLVDFNIEFSGAGFDEKEAYKEIIINKNGIKIGFLFCVDKSTGADKFIDKSFCVGIFDEERICQKISEIKKKADHVIFYPHWGMERFRIPSPEQRKQAKVFIDAGASIILGHHPHVLQGAEFYKDAPIFYSLGNFISNPVFWEDGDFLTWNRYERTGAIVTAEFLEKGIENIKFIPVFDDGKKIQIDRSDYALNLFKNLNKMISSGIGKTKYRKEDYYVKYFIPLIKKIKSGEIKKYLNFFK